MIEEAIGRDSRLTVKRLNGLLVDFARAEGALLSFAACGRSLTSNSSSKWPS